MRCTNGVIGRWPGDLRVSHQCRPPKGALPEQARHHPARRGMVDVEDVCHFAAAGQPAGVGLFRMQLLQLFQEKKHLLGGLRAVQFHLEPDCVLQQSRNGGMGPAHLGNTRGGVGGRGKRDGLNDRVRAGTGIEIPRLLQERLMAQHRTFTQEVNDAPFTPAPGRSMVRPLPAARRCRARSQRTGWAPPPRRAVPPPRWACERWRSGWWPAPVPARR